MVAMTWIALRHRSVHGQAVAAGDRVRHAGWPSPRGRIPASPALQVRAPSPGLVLVRPVPDRLLFSTFVNVTLLMVFIYWGWTGGVGERETVDSRRTPGRSAVIATITKVAPTSWSRSAKPTRGVGTEGVGLGNLDHGRRPGRAGCRRLRQRWIGTIDPLADHHGAHLQRGVDDDHPADCRAPRSMVLHRALPDLAC